MTDPADTAPCTAAAHSLSCCNSSSQVATGRAQMPDACGTCVSHIKLQCVSHSETYPDCSQFDSLSSTALSEHQDQPCETSPCQIGRGVKGVAESQQWLSLQQHAPFSRASCQQLSNSLGQSFLKALTQVCTRKRQKQNKG